MSPNKGKKKVPKLKNPKEKESTYPSFLGNTCCVPRGKPGVVWLVVLNNYPYHPFRPCTLQQSGHPGQVLCNPLPLL